jgi:hypothetical protein
MNLLGSTPCPTSWSALKSSKYHNDVALNGSPLSANAALSAVWAAAVNNGGSAKNIKPGVDFFHQLRSSGNFNSTDCNAAVDHRDLVPDHDQLGLPEHGGLLGPDRRHPLEGRRPEGCPVRRLLQPGREQVRSAPGGRPPLGRVPLLGEGSEHLAQGWCAPGRARRMVKAGTANKKSYKALPKVTNLSKAVIPTTAQSTTASAYVTSNW